MDNKKLKKLLSQLVVVGSTKKWFWSKTKYFEVQIYYTPIKKKILIITITGIEQNQLNLPFKLGDSIDDVRNWVEINEYEVKAEISRIN